MLYILITSLETAFSAAYLLLTGKLTSPGETSVTVSVHKQLHVQHLSGLRVVEHQDPLKEHHIRRIQRTHLLLPAGGSSLITLLVDHATLTQSLCQHRTQGHSLHNMDYKIRRPAPSGAVRIEGPVSLS